MTSPAQALADAFYALSEREFLQPYEKFPAEQEAVKALIENARQLGTEDFHAYSRALIQFISAHCHNSSLNSGALYRAFDGIDQVLEINYQETRQMMPANANAERLYERGGTGVQTSYSTILKVLEHLQPSLNSHLVDLGSGFGRVGLIAGLWRQDLKFSGYEFVNHRVEAANASASRAGLQERIHFYQQDLSAESFQIPEADAYYLYDPFTAGTYAHVYARLAALGKERSISVIAKAGAREGFQRCMDSSEWYAPESIDEGTVLLYRSR